VNEEALAHWGLLFHKKINTDAIIIRGSNIVLKFEIYSKKAGQTHQGSVYVEGGH